jgi:Bacteriophage Gp15 protein
MNILVDAMPKEVIIDMRNYPVHYDFRSCLRTIMAFEDNDLTPQEKQSIMLFNLYPRIPDNAEAACIQAAWFLNGGKEVDEDQDITTSTRVYSFSKDAGYIFAAFRQTHGIDLQKEDLHWWEFLALFMDLGSETMFCQLVSLRKRLKDGTATPEERKMAQALGEVIEVPELDDRTIEEKEAYAEFMRLTALGEHKEAV